MMAFLSKHKLLSVTMLCTAAWVLLSSISFRFIWPEDYFGFYPLIPASYFVYLIGAVLFFIRCRSQRHIPLRSFAIYKGVKLLLSVTALLLGAFVHPIYFMAYTIAILANYMVFLFIDTMLFKNMSQRVTATPLNSINNEISH